MKLRIDRKTFAQALAEVAPFAPAKPAIMVLKNARITTKDKWMKIEANDTETSIVRYVEMLECDTDGSFLIDITEFNKFIAKTRGEEIEIQVDGNEIKVVHSKGKAEFMTEDADVFPAFNMPEAETTEITIDAKVLADAISKARNFVSTEVIRPVMCAIYAYVEDGEFGYCASDTHRLIHGHTPIDMPDTKINWYIMPSVFGAIVNMCKTADMVKLQISDSHASYRAGGTVIQTVMAKGNFPNFRRVIPSEWAIECAVDKLELTDALGRLSLFCDVSQCVKLNITPMDMTISADNLSDMKKSTENLTHNGCGGDITIGVNVGNMSASVSVFGAGDVLMRMTDSNRPIVFAQQGCDNFVTLSMPMQLANG